MYKLTEAGNILRIEDNATIPTHLGNRDYLEYLDWVAKGHVADPIQLSMPTIQVCTAWQLRAALNQLGWRQQVEQAVSNSNDQNLIDAWNFAQNFEQNHPKVLQIATAIGKTGGDIQALFELAITLTP